MAVALTPEKAYRRRSSIIHDFSVTGLVTCYYLVIASRQGAFSCLVEADIGSSQIQVTPQLLHRGDQTVDLWQGHSDFSVMPKLSSFSNSDGTPLLRLSLDCHMSSLTQVVRSTPLGALMVCYDRQISFADH